MSAPVWLITGASNGFGLILCLRALRAGHKVIGSVRSKVKSSEAVKSIEGSGGSIIEMDMTEPQASIGQKMQAAEAIHGRIDILVNNAGFSIYGPIAQLDEKEIHRLFKTNVYGAVFAAQAVLPGMRARKSGTVVNVSSIAGLNPLPTGGLYAASKFALEGFSEALALEEEEFGVSVLIVEPGGFRTNFLNAFEVNERGIGRDTPSGLLGKSMAMWGAYDGKQPGDPVKAVEVIFQVVTGEGEAGVLRGKILRLPLGNDCLGRLEAKMASLAKDVGATKLVASGTDV